MNGEGRVGCKAGLGYGESPTAWHPSYAVEYGGTERSAGHSSDRAYETTGSASTLYAEIGISAESLTDAQRELVKTQFIHCRERGKPGIERMSQLGKLLTTLGCPHTAYELEALFLLHDADCDKVLSPTDIVEMLTWAKRNPHRNS